MILELQTASGGGPDNVVTVIVKHKDSSCSLVATLFTDTAVTDTNSSKEYIFSATLGAINFDDDDTLEIDIEQTAGSQTVRVHYDATAGGSSDSRILLPGASGAGRRIIIDTE